MNINERKRIITAAKTQKRRGSAYNLLRKNVRARLTTCISAQDERVRRSVQTTGTPFRHQKPGFQHGNRVFFEGVAYKWRINFKNELE